MNSFPKVLEDSNGTQHIDFERGEAGSFYSCPLTELYLPSQLENSTLDLFMGDKYVWMSNCDGSEKFEVFTRKGLKRIEVSESFFNTKKLRQVFLPDTVEDIEGYAFSGSGIQKLRIPDSVKRIQRSAFRHCRDLTEYVPPQCRLI